MKKIAIVLLILFALVLSLALSKNLIAMKAVTVVCKRMTGLEVSMKTLNIGFWNADIRVRDMKLYNSPGFEDRQMMDMPNLFISLDPATIFGTKTRRIKNLDFEIKEFVVVRLADGRLNLDALKPKNNTGIAKKKPTSHNIYIEKLHMKIGKVVYKDYSRGSRVFQQELNLNLDETYTDIANINALVPLVIRKAVLNTAMANLVKLDMGLLISNLDVTASDLADVGLGKFSVFASGITDTAGGMIDAATSFAGSGNTEVENAANEVANKAANGLKSIAGIFGAKEEKK